MTGKDSVECDKRFRLLLSDNRTVRKENLDDLTTILSDEKFVASTDFVSGVETFVYPCLNDTSEACRESAVQLVKCLVSVGHVTDIMRIVFIIHNRMTRETESSERIKLLYVQLLRDIVKITGQSISLRCMHDVIHILIITISADSCPAVKNNSCLCATELANANKTHFHSVAKFLVEPILETTDHHQLSTRFTAIESLNYIIMYSNGYQISKVCDTLRDRHFDQNVGVRLALYRVVANWMLNLPDKYSYFPKLVPLMLTAQVDEHQPNREEAERLWAEIGKQYINENKVQLKLPEYLNHYPPDVKRPNFGCRTLVTRELYELFSVIIRELDDTNEDVSMKSGQLLCVVALNAENSIIQHLNKLRIPMAKCCHRPNHVASTHVRRAAEIMSYFISPHTYLQFFLPAIGDDERDSGHMNVLSGLLKNAKPNELSTHVQSIVTVIVKPEICEAYDPVFKNYLLQVIEYMLVACKLECQAFSYELFKIYITVQSTTLVQFDKHFIFNELINMCEPKTKEQLFKTHGEKLLNELHDSCDTWTVYSTGRKVFDKIATDAGEYVISNCFKIYRQILAKTLQNLEKDPKFLIKILININTCVNKNIFIDSQLWQIISDIICPLQMWNPNKTFERLRATVCLCAQNIINKLTFYDDTILKQSFPIFLALADDSYSKTRLYALDALNTLVCAAKKLNKINADTINAISKVALARLSDDPGITRFKAINLLKVIYTEPIPDDYLIHCEAHITQLFKTIIIFLDDYDIQKCVLDLLKKISWMKPEVLSKHIAQN